ncbi:hypothetical protein [Lihuaxuella thermophila]|uniref:Uncharacterized protein n=1 Tax=Lihuaxuella thermophila TaxID=1173111 RepID=A0A1H8C6F1_9BACL|nr:hypothetical protein [Lihuaxuella thermophila]SEM90014.1 hypothetical protein SAMN05444955_10368 [Lihuaxuella thermophila]
MMKMGDMIPALKLVNLNVANVEPKDLTKNQLHMVFQLINDMLESHSRATPEEKAGFERYQNSYLSKRILHDWKRNRMKIKACAAVESSRQREICRTVFGQMKPMITGRFYEEYKGKGIEMNRLTFSAFLWNQRYISIKLRKLLDSKYWSEIIQFVDLLDEEDLFNG